MSHQDNFPKTWEAISEDNGYETKRLRVPGGWLVCVRDVPGRDWTLADFTLTWEEVSTDGDFVTKRLAVPSGWLVSLTDTANSQTTVTFVQTEVHTSGIFFVKDDRHHWDLLNASDDV